MRTPRRIVWKFFYHLGYRGFVLASLANFDFLWAWSWIDPDAAKLAKSSLPYHVIVHVAPLWLWGVTLLAIGLICGVQAWMDTDWPAWTMAIAIKMVLATLTIAAWPVAGVQVVRPALIWITLATLIFGLSRWPEPPRVECS
jgi:hypothetical protein